MFIAALFTSGQKVHTTQVSIDTWMDKQNVVYTVNKMWFSLQNRWNLDTCNNMDETWKHTKWNKADTKRKIFYDSIFNEIPT